MTRFLTESEKEREVQSFLSYREDASHFRQPHHKGGEGFIDPEILQLVDALNEIDGVCTIQSCCGHKYEARGCECYPLGSGEVVHPGQLWIRLSELTSRAFDRNIEVLIRTPSIRQVRKLYSFESQKEAHEVIDVNFKGLEVNEQCFNRSASFLWKFFNSIGGEHRYSNSSQT